MNELSDSECNFIFDSNDDDEYQDNSDEKEEETLQIFNLLNQKKNLSPYSNMQSEKENGNLDDDNEYSSIEDIPMNNNNEVNERKNENEKNEQKDIQDHSYIEDDEDFMQEEEECNQQANQKLATNQIKLEISKNDLEILPMLEEKDSLQNENEYKDENQEANTSQNSPRKKKKKSHSNKIPLHLLVTKNELNKESESKIIKEKPKRISKKEMKKMINRLTKPPQQKATPVKEESPKSKTQANPQTFDRLYQMSQEKVKKCEQLRKEFEEEEINYPIRKAEKSNKKSNELAEQQLCSFIEQEFPKKEFLTELELDGVLHKLGILDHKESMYKNPAIKSIMESWTTENEGKTVYSASQVKDSLISSATQRNYTKFDVYARQRMTIELSEIKQKIRNEKPEPPKEEKKISKETIMRLSQSRDPNPPKKQILSSPSNLKPKPKPKPRKPIISEELPPEGISQKTQEILESCDLAHVPFAEREKINAQKRSEKIKKLDEEIHNKKLDVGPQFGQKPQWSSDIKKKLDEYRQKKLSQPSDEPSFKPTVMSFKQYQKKVRKQMMSEQALPEGYEESVNRYRQAYQQGVQKKMEKAKRDPFYELTNVPL